ncbi:MAG: beta-ketoacyl-ACP synthase III [Planctomycetota bacterium]
MPENTGKSSPSLDDQLRSGYRNNGFGAEIIGCGVAVPRKVVTNTDLEQVMDTSDEWIVQRTGIKQRHIHEVKDGETTAALAADATAKALDSAGLTPADLDMMLVATMTPDAPTPSVSCLACAKLGTGHIAAIDVNAACSGFVVGLNTASAMIASGQASTIALVGADCLTKYMSFSTAGRNTAVLFGDAAAAVIIRRTTDASKGLIAQSMHADGSRSKFLYIETPELSYPEETELGEDVQLRMHGPAVFRFAVSTFPQLIAETLDKAGLQASDIQHYICHQSNLRILDAARDRFGLSAEQMHTNIDRYGNTVAASAPLVLNDLREAGRVKPGDRAMFLGFGAGLTWASSLWQL